MTDTDFPIEHFDGDDAHGPVTLFISDEGGLVFVCEKDDQAWTLDVKATPSRSKASRNKGLDPGPNMGLKADAKIRARTLDAARREFR